MVVPESAAQSGLAAGPRSVTRHRREQRPRWLVTAAVAFVVIALPVTVGLVACGDRAGLGGKTTLSVFWWGGAKRAELTEQALKLYTQRHPDVRFTTSWQGNSGYFDKLSTQVAAGHGPDLFQIDDNYLTEYAERKVTLDLTRYEESGVLDVSKLPPSLATYGQVAGRTVAVAASENTPAMVYNRSLLKRLKLAEPKVGMSYPDFVEWARRVSQASGGKVAGTMDPSADYKAFWLWLRARDTELYDGDKLGFTAQDLTEWFSLWKAARAAGATPSPDLIHQANAGDVAKQLVATGKAATSFVWSNQLPELQKVTKDDLAMVAYPGDPKGQWARASMYWAGYRGTDHADTVVDVINFLTNDPGAGKILGTERGLSANTDVRKAVEETLTDPKMKASVQYENALTPKFGPAPAPPPRGHGKIKSLLTTAAENIQFGRATPEAAAADFMKQANATLAR